LNLLEAAILGVVEGITEYLPISSTGHLIIASSLLGLDKPADVKRSVDAFNIVIQGGAILAVAGLYWPRIVQMIRGVSGGDSMGLRLVRNLFVAFLPAAVLGLLLDDLIEAHLFHPWPVIAALAVGGVAMILLGPWQRRRFHEPAEGLSGPAFTTIDELTWKQSLIIGLLQCVAMWPGTSRSMMTIVGGMLVGLRPKQAAEFSFLLGLPTLGAACVYKALKNFTANEPNMVQVLGWPAIVVGLITATISAVLAVRWLVGFLSKHGVSAFGWYRLALCVVLGYLIWQEMVDIEPQQ